MWRYRLGVRIRGSHPRDRGSIPRTATRVKVAPLRILTSEVDKGNPKTLRYSLGNFSNWTSLEDTSRFELLRRSNLVRSTVRVSIRCSSVFLRLRHSADA